MATDIYIYKSEMQIYHIQIKLWIYTYILYYVAEGWGKYGTVQYVQYVQYVEIVGYVQYVPYA